MLLLTQRVSKTIKIGDDIKVTVFGIQCNEVS